jgi:U11/U12 small nuclear ribonucleoprotein 35 kDa protein
VEKFSTIGKIDSCHLICDIVTGASKRYAFVVYDSSKSAYKAYKCMNMELIDNYTILVDYEMERTMPGWKPRRLGGGFGGKKESGQLRFGCRTRPFQKPIVFNKTFRDTAHRQR